jgi:hypothetical protein
LEEKLVEEREAKGANTVAPCTETEGKWGRKNGTGSGAWLGSRGGGPVAQRALEREPQWPATVGRDRDGCQLVIQGHALEGRGVRYGCGFVGRGGGWLLGQPKGNSDISNLFKQFQI